MEKCYQPEAGCVQFSAGYGNTASSAFRVTTVDSLLLSLFDQTASDSSDTVAESAVERMSPQIEAVSETAKSDSSAVSSYRSLVSFRTGIEEQLNVAYTRDEYWSKIDGSLGLAYSNDAFTFLKLITTYYTHKNAAFMLDLNGIEIDGNNPSYLYTGNRNDIFAAFADKQPVVWSEEQYDVDTASVKLQATHDFPLFDLSLCGNSLFSNYSSFWFATINTGVQGLYLPLEFYRMVLRQLNISSTETVIKRPEDLPVLSFRLQEQAQSRPRFLSDSSQLFLPLRDLYDPESRRLAHLHALEDAIKSFQGVLYYDHKIQIIFGTRALLSLRTYFDIGRHRIGLQNKHLTEWTATLTSPMCATPKQCVGEQTLYVPMNECLDPLCSAYYFQEVDHETKTCKLSMIAQVVIVAVLLVIAAAELLYFEFHKRLSNRLALQRNGERHHID